MAKYKVTLEISSCNKGNGELWEHIWKDLVDPAEVGKEVKSALEHEHGGITFYNGVKILSTEKI